MNRGNKAAEARVTCQIVKWVFIKGSAPVVSAWAAALLASCAAGRQQEDFSQVWPQVLFFCTAGLGWGVEEVCLSSDTRPTLPCTGRDMSRPV